MKGDLIASKTIEPIFVRSLYDTGLPDVYESNGLKFHWFSWVLCEIAGSASNPVHRAIFTGFRCDNFRRSGEAKKVRATRWNPTYEDEEHVENLPLDRLWYWKPIAVITDEAKDTDDQRAAS